MFISALAPMSVAWGKDGSCGSHRLPRVWSPSCVFGSPSALVSRRSPLFVTQSGTSLSRDAVEHRLAKYVQIATRACPSLGQKTISMHVLRHSAAMRTAAGRN